MPSVSSKYPSFDLRPPSRPPARPFSFKDSSSEGQAFNDEAEPAASQAPATAIRATMFASHARLCVAALAACLLAESAAFRLHMSSEPAFSKVKIISNEPAVKAASPNLRKIKVDLGALAESYTTAGQYCQIRENDGGKAGFYALASPPNAGSSEVEFLIKEAESNAWLCKAASGSAIQATGAAGSGFRVEENFDSYKFDFPVQNILLFAAGTGIAPIKAAIESKSLRLDEGRTCKLYYGAKGVDTMAYKELFEEWEELGVEVVPCFSQGDAAGEIAGSKTGYVQHALEEDGVPLPRNNGVLMCGMKGMTEAVRGILSDAGVIGDRILLNF